jgi:hypothetical protein
LPVLNNCKQNNHECAAFGINCKIREYQGEKVSLGQWNICINCIQQQEFSFSRAGAHHQNGVAKKNIKTVAQWA